MPQSKIEIGRFEWRNGQHGTGQIEFVEHFHAADLTYDAFFRKFMVDNVPVIISGIADQWDCTKWTTGDSVDFDYLRQQIECSVQVPVANCSKAYYNAHEKADFTFDEFLIYWHDRINGSNDQQDRILYLKDWHLRRQQPGYKFYETPSYFASDWLNEYCIETDADDYRFVYMGPKGTWTPLHADVFSSFSWSTNIMGTKKWIFFAPGEERPLYDQFRNLPADVNEAKCRQIIDANKLQVFEISQEAGQTIFVPSGWHHQVWNVADTISVNHNWFNGCNIMQIWHAMNSKLQEIRQEIDDCKDMDNFDEHCQVMLKSVFGLDFNMFFDILRLVVKNRLKILDAGASLVLNEAELGENHAIFDLSAVHGVAQDILDNCGVDGFRQSAQQILSTIEDSKHH